MSNLLRNTELSGTSAPSACYEEGSVLRLQNMLAFVLCLPADQAVCICETLPFRMIGNSQPHVVTEYDLGDKCLEVQWFGDLDTPADGYDTFREDELVIEHEPVDASVTLLNFDGGQTTLVSGRKARPVVTFMLSAEGIFAAEYDQDGIPGEAIPLTNDPIAGDRLHDFMLRLEDAPARPYSLSPGDIAKGYFFAGASTENNVA